MPIEIRRRLPAVEKPVSEISQNDIRVRVLGRVIDKTNSVIVVDDGSGKLEIQYDQEPGIAVGEAVKIVTRVFPLIDGYECKAECFQKLDGLDLGLYKKARSIVAGLGK